MLNNEIIIKRFKLLYNNQFEYLDLNYKGIKVDIKIHCTICNADLIQTPSYHLKGHGCSECNKLKDMYNQKTTEQFIIDAKLIHEEKYDYSKVKYKNAYTEVEIICKNNHAPFWQLPFVHLSGCGCPECGKESSRIKRTKPKKTSKKVEDKRKKLKYTTIEMIQKFIIVQGNRYSYSNFVYLGYKEKGFITCSIHGDFPQTPNDHLTGCGCPDCANEKLRQERSLGLLKFIEKANLKHHNFYDYSLNSIDNYVNNNSIMKIICPICGEFSQKGANHLQGQGCPSCFTIQSSKGEKEIEYLLKLNNFKFRKQKTFPNCRCIDLLRFDFYLKEYNLCIEYNGILHYESIEFFSGEKAFKETQERDNIKVEYCKNNNINLLIIPYWEFNNIKSILNNYLIPNIELDSCQYFNDSSINFSAELSKKS